MVGTVAVTVALLFVLLRYTRLGMRIRAGTLDLETVSALGINVGQAALAQFRRRHLSRRPQRRPGRGSARPRADDGTGLLMPSFVAIIVGGVGQPDRHVAGRFADRCRLGRHGGVSAGGKRSNHVRADGGGATDPTTRPARRRRHDDMSEQAAARRLLRSPRSGWRCCSRHTGWRRSAGTPRSGHACLVLGLAAMSVNFLLGFTGVLSFGHAAYFGLGAYGAGFALKFLAPSTPLALLCGMLLGGIAGALLGALIARRRGVYFAMVTIAFGQVFYYIAFQWSSVTGGDDGLRGFSRQPLDLGFITIDILSNANAFYYFVLFCLALAVGVMGFILRSPFGRTMIAIRENRAARPLSREFRSTVISGSRSRFPASSWASPARCTPSSTTSPIRAGCTTASPAIS